MDIENHTKTTLQVGIVGAGIAGLAAGLAFRRAGHNVTIYERSQFRNEIGAAITLTPNANLILDRWGFDAVKAGATKNVQTRRLDGATLELLDRQQWADVEENYGHSLSAFHRVDLHNGLREMVEAAGVDIALAKEVIRLDCANGVLQFQGGDEEKKDVLVVADGIKAPLLKDIIGHEIPRKSVGAAVYRTLIPMSKLRSDPEIWPLFDNEPSGFVTSTPNKNGTMYITYPCSRGEVLNVAIFHRLKETKAPPKDDWSSPATVQDAVDALSGMHPMWTALTKHADDMKVFSLWFRDPVPTMVRGRTVVIGDAAHPMSPTHAQGGCMGLEDAAAFEILFGSSHFGPGDCVEDRLRLYNQFRLPRSTVSAIVSNAMFYRQGSGTSVKIEAEKFYSGKIPSSPEGWTAEIRGFFYGYDVFTEAEKAMKFKNTPGGLPEHAVHHFWSRAETI